MGLLALAVLFVAVSVGDHVEAVLVGEPVAASLGRCVNYEDEGGEVCKDFVRGPVYYVPDGVRTFGELEVDVVASLRDAAALGEPGCVAASVPFACGNYFPACHTVSVDGVEFAFPLGHCLSFCEKWWDACSTQLQAAVAYGYGDSFASCGTEGHGIGPADRFGTKVKHRGQLEYPDGLQGELLYPEVSNTWTSPDDAALQVDLPCVVPVNASVDLGIVEAGCGVASNIMEKYDIGLGETCYFSCPHPLFSASEYDMMRLAYVVPGLVGGALCTIIVLDSLLQVCAARRNSRRHKRHKKSKSVDNANSLFQITVGICGVVYMAVGPLAVTILGDVGCNGLPVTPGATTTGYLESPTRMCVLQRASIFVVMGLLNTSLAQMVMTHKMLCSAATMEVQMDRQYWKRKARRLVAVALGVPSILCAVMYSLDELEMSASNYQAQLARWSLWCGPRLTTVQEITLIYAPFVVTGVLTSLQSVKSWALLRSFVSGTMTAVEPASALNSSVICPHFDKATVRAIRKLNQKVTLLGLSCAVMLIVYVSATAMLVQALASSTNQYIDWFVCFTASREIPNDLLSAFNSCAEAFAVTGDEGHERPDPSLLALTYLAEALTVCIFGAFHAANVVKRALDERKATQINVPRQ